ncbi:MAG: M66 family metalloprotease, partial [Anaerolineales bacterium]
GTAAPTANTLTRLPIILNNWPKPPAPLYLPLVARPEPPPPPITVDLSVSRVEIIQGITLSDPYTVQIAHRPAMMRVFLNLSGADSQSGVYARLTRYVGGAPQDSLIEGPISVLPSTDEGSLAQTLNYALPENWLEPGTAYVVEVDPDGSVPETDEGNNRFPGGGDQSFDFQNAPALEVTIVPVRYARPGALVTQPPTGDLSYLTWMPLKVYPLSQINYTVRGGFYTFSGDLRTTDGWSDLLSDITNLHSVEDLSEQRLFFGLVDSVGADGCSGGCIAGIGWLNGPPGGNPGYASKSAVGFAGFSGSREAASPTFTHEMGHNFGRPHAPCGTSNGVGFFPYNNASIGQWGFDIASSQLYDPGSYRDYMSYCGPEWTSDYTYKSIFDAWGWVSNPFGAAAVAGAEDALVISGYRDNTGAWHVAPARSLRVPAGAAPADGPLLLELLDAAGQVLASQPFALQPMSLDRLDSGEDLAGFRVALPVIEGASGFRIRDGAVTLFEQQVSGEAPTFSGEASWTASEAEARLKWRAAGGQASGLTYDVRFSPDGGARWIVLALGQATAEIPLERSMLASATAPIVEVQASDGVRTASRIYAVPAEFAGTP